MAIKTPYYIFNKSRFREIIQEYKSIGEIFYPIKSNDEDLIINTLIDESCNFEVDSIEHIKLLINNYHVNPSKILYSYPILEYEDIIQANNLGIRKYVVDSNEEYENICSIVKTPRFFVRLNAVSILDPNFPDSQNKWGLPIKESKELIKRIRNDNHEVIGISFYLFKEIVSHKSLKNILKTIEIEFSDYSFKYLNIGGGISPLDISKVFDILLAAKKAIGATNVIVEPGTPLLNPCIDMVVSVTSIRNINGCRFVFINSGIYNGLIDIIIKQRHFIINDLKSEKSSDKINTIVCGSSSDVSDCLGEYKLRTNLRVGDQLIIKGCGAYSTVMQTNFYRKEPIPMILAEGSDNEEST